MQLLTWPSYALLTPISELEYADAACSCCRLLPKNEDVGEIAEVVRCPAKIGTKIAGLYTGLR